MELGAALENGEEGADGLAEEGTATDAGTVGDYVAEFDGAAGGEMLARLHEYSQKKHREARPKPSPAVLESDHRQKGERQVGAEVHHLVVDVQTADVHHHRRGSGQQGADDHAADEYGPKGQDEGAPCFRREAEQRCGFILWSNHAINCAVIGCALGDGIITLHLQDRTGVKAGWDSYPHQRRRDCDPGGC